MATLLQTKAYKWYLGQRIQLHWPDYADQHLIYTYCWPYLDSDLIWLNNYCAFHMYHNLTSGGSGTLLLWVLYFIHFIYIFILCTYCDIYFFYYILYFRYTWGEWAIGMHGRYESSILFILFTYTWIFSRILLAVKNIDPIFRIYAYC
jgi:hypothetical protein